MKVYFVGAGPGDMELITIKGKRLLESCMVCVYAGSLVNEELLRYLPDGAERHDSASMSLDEIVAVFESARARGLDVVRLHTGDPSIYGAINEQMARLDEMGMEYEIVPGVSSFQAAAAALKTELTAPEISQTITLTRTSGRTPLPEKQELSAIARTEATLCIFLSAHKIDDVAKTLIPNYGEDCPAAVVYHASWPDEKIAVGTLRDIAETANEMDITKTAIIIVGRAVRNKDTASKLYDKAFTHGFRKAAE